MGDIYFSFAVIRIVLNKNNLSCSLSQLATPEFQCPFISVDKRLVLSSDDRLSHLAWFIRNSILLAAETLYQVNVQVRSWFLCGCYFIIVVYKCVEMYRGI